MLPEVSAGVLRAESLQLALAIAREHALRNFDLCSCDDCNDLAPSLVQEFGEVRVRQVPGRKNLPARRRAHALLRKVAPLRNTERECGLAEWGVDLEIARPEGDEDAAPF